MAKWMTLTAPAALVMSVGSAAHAVQYLTIAEAQKQAFPSATSFAVVQADRIWRAEAAGVAPVLCKSATTFAIFPGRRCRRITSRKA